MAPKFLGFDHIDTRVRSVALVEPFYDAFMPLLGLTRKTYAYVDVAGDWHDPDEAHPYDAIEYHEPVIPGEPGRFIGFIEDASMQPVRSRIAFAVASPEAVREWAVRCRDLGARNIELSEDFDAYPAVFFEDPAGTKLELCARNSKGSSLT